MWIFFSLIYQYTKKSYAYFLGKFLVNNKEFVDNFEFKLINLAKKKTSKSFKKTFLH